MELFGAGTDSGTFDYFTEVINGKAKAAAADYSASENDNILVSGVTGKKYSMGYFGFGYYVTWIDKLKAVTIIPKECAACVAPRPKPSTVAAIPLSGRCSSMSARNRSSGRKSPRS